MLILLVIGNNHKGNHFVILVADVNNLNSLKKELHDLIQMEQLISKKVLPES